MPEAHVTDVAAVDEFRVSLGTFAESARQALTDIELEVRRAMDWITRDRPAYWRNEARRAAEAVAQAKDDLANARTFKKIDDYTPACAEEKKQLELAQRRLKHAEEKIEIVKQWSRTAARAVDEFQGPLQQLMGTVDGDLPRAMAVLQRTLEALQRYAAVAAPAAIKWEELTGKSSESMARPEDEPEDAKGPTTDH